MQNALRKALVFGVLAGGLSASAGLAYAQQEPEVCPEVKPGDEALAGLAGSWTLTEHDGEKPGQAMVVRFLDQGKAEIRISDQDPIAATYGTNCCGFLVLSQVQGESDDEPVKFTTLIADFEVADNTLTLFARDGDWVFTKLEPTSRRD